MTEPKNDQDMLGTILDGRFRIDEFIGAGGMGSVFKATQLNVNRPVAVKLIRIDEVSPLQAQRFEREARIMATFTHPNIVQFYDLGRTPDNVIFIVMEFVDGLPLGTLLRDGRMAVEVCVDVGTQLFGALAEAHARGIVHRDIKPDNMLLSAGTSGELRLKVLDFGLAHQHEDVRLTQAGRVSGTPYYIAPEMARGQAVTFQSDLYSAGVVLYEMLTGKPPFTGQSMQVMFKHVNESPPTLSQWVNQGMLPTRLVNLIMSLLEKDPANRPASAAFLLTEFMSLKAATSVRNLAESTQVHPALDLATAERILPNEVRLGSVPNLEAPQEIVGAWEAFNAAAESAPEAFVTMDPNIDSSFEFEGGYAESDLAMAPAAERSVHSVDQLSEIVIPAGARVMATDQLQAVVGPAKPKAEAGSAFAPLPVKKELVLESIRNQPTATTAQVHAEQKPKRSVATPIALFVVVIALLVFVGGAIYVQFSGPEPPAPASAEQEQKWQRQKEAAEARQAAQAKAAAELYANPDEPAKKTQKKVVRKRNNGEVIELFENQDDMKEADRLKIERRK